MKMNRKYLKLLLSVLMFTVMGVAVSACTTTDSDVTPGDTDEPDCMQDVDCPVGYCCTVQGSCAPCTATDGDDVDQ